MWGYLPFEKFRFHFNNCSRSIWVQWLKIRWIFGSCFLTTLVCLIRCSRHLKKNLSYRKAPFRFWRAPEVTLACRNRYQFLCLTGTTPMPGKSIWLCRMYNDSQPRPFRIRKPCLAKVPRFLHISLLSIAIWEVCTSRWQVAGHFYSYQTYPYFPVQFLSLPLSWLILADLTN